ncbi:MAG: cysteine dioxygenase family protein [Acidobacteriota bacterium]
MPDTFAPDTSAPDKSTRGNAADGFEFQGLAELTQRFDDAVSQDHVDKTTSAVQETLTDMLSAGRVELPAHVLRPVPGKYARRLLYRSPEHGYVVIAMIWGPDQGTALHDHDGVWCVEGVLQGEIEVVRYEPLGRDGDRWKFRQDATLQAHVGEAGTLIPPFEYHTIANRSDASTAVTIHVYGREMTKASIFQPQGEDSYERIECQLSYDPCTAH